MRRVYQGASLIILAASLWVVFESGTRLKYYSEYGPGPGFFPFWLGVVLVVLSVVWLAQVSLQPVQGKAMDIVPYREGFLRVVAVLLAMSAFTLLADVFGTQLTMFAFLLSLILGLGRQRLVTAVIVSLVGSWALMYGFRDMLDVQMPLSSIEWLAKLGL